MPKPIPCHECTDVTILACSTWSLIFQFLHARSPSVIFRPCLSLWFLFAPRVSDQVPSHEDRPRIKLNSVKHYCLHKHWHSDWWASIPNSLLGRCDLLRTCQYNVGPEQGTVWMAAQRYQCLLPQRYIMYLKGTWGNTSKVLAFYETPDVMPAQRKASFSIWRAGSFLFCSLLYCVCCTWVFSWLNSSIIIINTGAITDFQDQIHIQDVHPPTASLPSFKALLCIAGRSPRSRLSEIVGGILAIGMFIVQSLDWYSLQLLILHWLHRLLHSTGEVPPIWFWKQYSNLHPLPKQEGSFHQNLGIAFLWHLNEMWMRCYCSCPPLSSCYSQTFSQVWKVNRVSNVQGPPMLAALHLVKSGIISYRCVFVLLLGVHLRQVRCCCL